MRMYPLFLVTAFTISSYVDAISTRSSLTFERSAPSHQQAVQRFLRDGAEPTSEERVSFGNPKSEDLVMNPLLDKFSKSLPDNLDTTLLQNKNFLKVQKKLLTKQKGTTNEVMDMYMVERLESKYSKVHLIKFFEDNKEDPFVSRLVDAWISYQVVKNENLSTDDV